MCISLISDPRRGLHVCINPVLKGYSFIETIFRPCCLTSLRVHTNSLHVKERTPFKPNKIYVILGNEKEIFIRGRV